MAEGEYTVHTRDSVGREVAGGCERWVGGCCEGVRGCFSVERWVEKRGEDCRRGTGFVGLRGPGGMGQDSEELCC